MVETTWPFRQDGNRAPAPAYGTYVRWGRAWHRGYGRTSCGRDVPASAERVAKLPQHRKLCGRCFDQPDSAQEAR